MKENKKESNLSVKIEDQIDQETVHKLKRKTKNNSNKDWLNNNKYKLIGVASLALIALGPVKILRLARTGLSMKALSFLNDLINQKSYENSKATK